MKLSTPVQYSCAARHAVQPSPIPSPPRPRARHERGRLEADLVVGHLVATRGDALAHLGEELPLGLRLAGELDEGGLERVERQVDVGVPGEGREGGGGVKGKRGNIARL